MEATTGWRRRLALAIALLLLGCPVVTLSECVGRTGLPSTLRVNDTAIWDNPTGWYLYPPFYSGARRLILLGVNAGLVDLRSDDWGSGAWGTYYFTVPANKSTIYWLNVGAQAGDPLQDFIYLSKPTITNLTDTYDEETGQQVILVFANAPGRAWTLRYDASARLALRFECVGLTRDRYVLYNTTVDLGLPVTFPFQLALYAFWIAPFAIIVGASVILWHRERRKRRSA